MKLGRWNARLSEYEKGKSSRETLTLIATFFLKDMEDPARREFFKILHFESHKNPAILNAWKESPMQNCEGFYAVFAKHMEGRFSKKKISMFITQFMGALIHYVNMAKLRGENFCPEPFDDASYIQQLVDTFSGGLSEKHH